MKNRYGFKSKVSSKADTAERYHSAHSEIVWRKKSFEKRLYKSHVCMSTGINRYNCEGGSIAGKMPTKAFHNFKAQIFICQLNFERVNSFSFESNKTIRSWCCDKVFWKNEFLFMFNAIDVEASLLTDKL